MIKFNLQTALVIAIGASLIIAPQFPLALIALGLLAHLGWTEWIEYKANTRLDPYVRKIELLQESYNEVKQQLASTVTATEIEALKNEVQKLSLSQGLNRRG